MHLVLSKADIEAAIRKHVATLAPGEFIEIDSDAIPQSIRVPAFTYQVSPIDRSTAAERFADMRARLTKKEGDRG